LLRSFCNVLNKSILNMCYLLGVTISSDLSTFLLYVQRWLRQIRRIHRSIDRDSAAALVHALIASSVDYCNTVLAGTPRTITDRFQQVLNAAARVVSGARKFYHGLSQLLHFELHWLDIPQCVQYKLGVTIHRCLQDKAPLYLMDYCTRTPSQHVWSSGFLRCRSDEMGLASTLTPGPCSA